MPLNSLFPLEPHMRTKAIETASQQMTLVIKYIITLYNRAEARPPLN